MTQVLETI